MSDDYSEWLREHAKPKSPSRISHCLSHHYQLYDFEPNVGAPYFMWAGPRRMDPRWPTYDGSTEEEWLQVMDNEYFDRFNSVVARIWNGFASAVETDYERLVRLESSMARRSERIAQSIDEQFATTNPETGEFTSTLDEAIRFFRMLQDLDEEYGAQTPFGGVVDIATEERVWHIGSKMSSSVYAAEGHWEGEYERELSALREHEKRSCFRVQDMGFSCEISYLPANVGIGALRRLFLLYFEDLEERADEVGNAHALLNFRLEVLRHVLCEYEMHGEARPLSSGETPSHFNSQRHRPGGRAWHTLSELKKIVEAIEDEHNINAAELSDNKLADFLLQDDRVIWESKRHIRRKIAELRRGHNGQKKE